MACLVGFTLGAAFGLIAGYFNGSWVDKSVSALSVAGVSVPHYWLGMVLVIVFSVCSDGCRRWAPVRAARASGAGTPST